ncbi:MAG: hypothetical protein LJE96_02885, partial [Deltaproteobacteria bacterium]|nr:hypothetical protein [Deltaproteobacteria bacterium]
MKTILIGITQGFAARYLLRTDILKTLLETGDVRIVVLTPNFDEPYFRKEFSSCRIHEFRTEACKRYYDRSRIRNFVLQLRKTVLNSHERLPFIDDKFDVWSRKTKRESNRAVWLRKGCSHVLRRSRLARRGLVKTESDLWKGHFHREIFLKYRPDLTIACSNGYFLHDALLLREARYHGSKTMVVVLSWDNPTSKGYGGAFPDFFVSWTDA